MGVVIGQLVIYVISPNCYSIDKFMKLAGEGRRGEGRWLSSHSPGAVMTILWGDDWAGQRALSLSLRPAPDQC